MKNITIIMVSIMPFLIFSCKNTPAENNADIFTYDFTGKETALPVPTAEKLPSSWKGFNLLNMFYLKGQESDIPFNEKEFKMMSDWGFNFARIPIDYRILIKSNNWNNMNESAMRQLDKAVEYGIKYNIHICLNLHRAPGYTVASPAETTNLWTQAKPQEAFARMWGFIAKRYKNIPNEYLSFNFLNEPSGVDEKTYADVIKKAADAIRAHNPDRILIADGLNYGNISSDLIKELGIAQATRGYTPFSVTHYKADWVEGANDLPLPTWPVFLLPKYLYGLQKNEVPRSVFRIEHNFNMAYNLDVNVGIVSHEARLVVKADGIIIYDRLYKSGPGSGEWTQAVYSQEWKIYQNIFNKDYRIDIPAGAQIITLEVTDGDWMSINDLKFSPVGKTAVNETAVSFSVTPNVTGWGELIPSVKINANGQIITENAPIQNKEWLKNTCIKPWDELIKNGGGAMVGEWGAYNRTPHDVVLRWMEDNLLNFKEAGMGWALWNLTGSFGVLNSGRNDVNYENYNGYKLDRKMLNLLQKYL
ncbi:MAG: glycoside hydrolase family 5 protein [Treponema sp.]|jgi:aryl-phospho-beta-D-glucosidase BglC (GH1 family)|nr:glycoside hydrolase family 5 protein [Treponema sp.]